MSCKDCFNGCVETTSDKCVKYTGPDVPELGIETGDSLAVVEAAIIENLVSVLDGTGIILDISEELICELVQDFLPSAEEISVVDYIKALIQATCALKVQVDANTEQLAIEDADYVVECLPNVSPEDGTHAVLQDLIGVTCQLKIDFVAYIEFVSLTYVKITDIDQYIQDYLDSIGTSTLVKNSMTPNCVVEYYGPLSNFDQSGAGLGDWAEIYLCNGNNNTPDKRGYAAVGATTGMGGGAMSPVVDPAFPGNPDYTLLASTGVNIVTLTSAQMPVHDHVITVEVAGAHGHDVDIHATRNEGNTGSGDSIADQDPQDSPRIINPPVSVEGDHIHTASAGLSGGGEAHSIIQPVLVCYYIMYIPAP